MGAAERSRERTKATETAAGQLQLDARMKTETGDRQGVDDESKAEWEEDETGGEFGMGRYCDGESVGGKG